MGVSILNNKEVALVGRAGINRMIVSDNPDWAEKDADISFKLTRLFMLIANKTQIANMQFSIAERSDDEKEPHYLIDAGIGEETDDNYTNIDLEYAAIENENVHFGEIKLFIRFEGTECQRDFIGRILLEEYIKLLEFYYPEFNTAYFEPDIEERYIPYQYLLRNGE